MSLLTLFFQIAKRNTCGLRSVCLFYSETVFYYEHDDYGRNWQILDWTNFWTGLFCSPNSDIASWQSPRVTILCASAWNHSRGAVVSNNNIIRYDGISADKKHQLPADKCREQCSAVQIVDVQLASSGRLGTVVIKTKLKLDCGRASMRSICTFRIRIDWQNIHSPVVLLGSLVSEQGKT